VCRECVTPRVGALRHKRRAYTTRRDEDHAAGAQVNASVREGAWGDISRPSPHDVVRPQIEALATREQSSRCKRNRLRRSSCIRVRGWRFQTAILRYLQKYSMAVESLGQIDNPSIWMVSEMVQSAAADEVFHALSNPTRRKVLERLSVGPATVSELAAPFDMQLPSFVQHLSVLEQSRLVRSKKRGRVRTYEIAPERFKVVEDWLTARRQLWEARLDQFDQYVKQLKEKESES
jgi:DNA-binding transcriptional ArsR family regulator